MIDCLSVTVWQALQILPLIQFNQLITSFKAFRYLLFIINQKSGFCLLFQLTIGLCCHVKFTCILILFFPSPSLQSPRTPPPLIYFLCSPRPLTALMGFVFISPGFALHGSHMVKPKIVFLYSLYSEQYPWIYIS